MSWQITDLAGVAGLLRQIREWRRAEKEWPLEEQKRIMELVNSQLDCTSKALALAKRYDLRPQDILALMPQHGTFNALDLERIRKRLPKKY